MGKMLLWKFSEQQSVSKQNLYAFNRTVEKLDEAKEIAQIVCTKELAAICDIVFVCVRPTDIKSVLEEIKDSIKKDALVVSLNGSISFKTLNATLDCKTAKVIPSLTAEIGRSQTLACFNGKVTNADKRALRELFTPIGDFIVFYYLCHQIIVYFIKTD